MPTATTAPRRTGMRETKRAPRPPVAPTARPARRAPPVRPARILPKSIVTPSPAPATMPVGVIVSSTLVKISLRLAPAMLLTSTRAAQMM